MSRGQALPSAVFGNIFMIHLYMERREENPAAPSVSLSLLSPRCQWEDRGGDHLSLQQHNVPGAWGGLQGGHSC